MEAIAVFGAGGHARSVVDILLTERRYQIACLVDKSPTERKGFCDIPLVGEDNTLLHSIESAIVAIGDNRIRRNISEMLLARGIKLINAISPFAYVSKNARLGCGIAIMPFAVVGSGTVVGDGVIINTKVSLDHDCSIGSYCHIAPGATMCGYVKVGDNSFICAGATAIDKIIIGSECIIGAGAVVVRNVENNATVMGVPARQRKEETNDR